MGLDAQQRERLGLIIAGCLYAVLGCNVVAGLLRAFDSRVSPFGFRETLDVVVTRLATPPNAVLAVAAALLVVAVSPSTRARLVALVMIWIPVVIGACGCWYLFEVWSKGDGLLANGFSSIEKVAVSLEMASIVGLCGLAIWLVRSRLLPPPAWGLEESDEEVESMPH